MTFFVGVVPQRYSSHITLIRRVFNYLNEENYRNFIEPHNTAVVDIVIFFNKKNFKGEPNKNGVQFK